MKQKQNKIEFSILNIIVTILVCIALLSLGLLWVRGAIEKITQNCSKNPNAEGCVCDEWDGITKEVFEEKCKEPYCYLGKDNAIHSLGMEDSITYGNYWFIHPCIKSHNPNECEKGNKDYVWENKTIKKCYSQEYSKGATINLYFCDDVEIKECRKKTDLEKFKDKLDSYDCEKLLLDMTEDCCSDEFGLCSEKCKYNYYKDEDNDLKDIFLLKNCEVK